LPPRVSVHNRAARIETRATVPSAAATEMRRHLDEIERTLDRTAPRAAHALRDVFAGYRHAR
jgi:hypothetical protein